MYHLITEEWKGSPITVRQEDAWWNLTEMCAAFGKRPNDFLSLPGTRAYIDALLLELRKSPGAQLPENLVIETRRGQHGSGTWAHPFLAMECARWLSPEFSVKCNEVIIRILKGETIQGAPLTPTQRRLRKQRLKLRGTELRVEIDAVRRQLEAMRAAEDLPGHMAVSEWLALRGLTLAHGDLCRLCIRLAADARRGLVTTGEKTLSLDTTARCKRVPTYAPESISAVYRDLFPTALEQG